MAPSNDTLIHPAPLTGTHVPPSTAPKLAPRVGFKAYTHFTRPVLEAIVDEAHKHRARVTGHLQSVSCAAAADAGIDNVEHSWFSCLADLRPSGAGDSRDARANALFLKLVKAHLTLTATPRANTNRTRRAIHLCSLCPGTCTRC